MLDAVHAVPEEYWLAHNGIKVPLMHEQKDISIATNKVSKRARVHARALETHHYLNGEYHRIYYLRGATIGVLALTDSLRPDVSLARDRLVKLPLEIYSEVNLAFLEAKKSIDSALLKESLIWQDLREPHQVLGDLLKDDGHLIDRERWIRQSIFRVRNDYLRLEELREVVSKEGRVSLFQEDLWKGDDRAFVKAYKRALIQLNINVELIGVQSKWHLVAKPGEPLSLVEGDLHFPPLFFVPYADSDVLLDYYTFYNRNHPFSKWLLHVAPILDEKYPGLLDEIRSPLLEGWGTVNLITETELLPTMRRIAQVDPEIAPPDEAFLSEDDFVKPRRKDQ